MFHFKDSQIEMLHGPVPFDYSLYLKSKSCLSVSAKS